MGEREGQRGGEGRGREEDGGRGRGGGTERRGGALFPDSTPQLFIVPWYDKKLGSGLSQFLLNNPQKKTFKFVARIPNYAIC